MRVEKGHIEVFFFGGGGPKRSFRIGARVNIPPVQEVKVCTQTVLQRHGETQERNLGSGSGEARGLVCMARPHGYFVTAAARGGADIAGGYVDVVRTLERQRALSL